MLINIRGVLFVRRVVVSIFTLCKCSHATHENKTKIRKSIIDPYGTLPFAPFGAAFGDFRPFGGFFPPFMPPIFPPAFPPPLGPPIPLPPPSVLSTPFPTPFPLPFYLPGPSFGFPHPTSTYPYRSQPSITGASTNADNFASSYSSNIKC